MVERSAAEERVISVRAKRWKGRETSVFVMGTGGSSSLCCHPKAQAKSPLANYSPRGFI